MNQTDWSQIRSQMLLDPRVINLNTGSFGPLPRVVFDRATELRRRLAEEPMDFLVRQVPPLLWESRECLGAFLNAEPRRLLFTANVTAAVNLVASSLKLASPGVILLTDHEYGAMHWCWERAAQRQGLSLQTFPLPPLPSSVDEIVGAFTSAISDRTRLLFFSHVLSPTGMVLPVREICAEAKRRGITTVIDGAHAPAMIPVSLEELGCDFYGGNCHKWLLAPTGAGFLWFAQDQADRLQPLQVSWGSHHESSNRDERDEFGSTPRLRALEFEGTRDPCPWLAVPAAIRFQEQIGRPMIRERIAQLTGYVRKKLGNELRLKASTPPHPKLHGAMTAFRLPGGMEVNALRQSLWNDFRIEAPIVERPGELLVRVSTHFYNTEDEVDRLAAALTTILNRR